MKAWHFTSDALRNGRPLPPDGETLIHDGPLEMCESGLHASKLIIDALNYAPGNVICRVSVGGEIERDTDKMVCRERTILWRIDGEKILRRFARLCALDVIDQWDAPDVVRKYLETGDERLRDAARDAAWAAVWVAAGDAARVAARDAARVAARVAARGAAWDAAWVAAGDAAWVAARVAAGDAARVAARGAARDAAWDAARGAARDAAWAAVWAAQNKRLTRMVTKARPQ